MEVDTKQRLSSEKRRQGPQPLKGRILAGTLEPGSPDSIVARRHDVNTVLGADCLRHLRFALGLSVFILIRAIMPDFTFGAEKR